MNSTSNTTAAPSRLDDEKVDAAKTAKFLANLQRTVHRRDPDDAPAPTVVAVPAAVVASAPNPVPVMRAVEEAQTPAAAVEPVAKAPVASRRRATARAGGQPDKVQMEVTLDPGTASRVVYIRVDKTLADRLAVIAFQNKINGGASGPATINDIGVAALHRWIDEYERAA
jgi:hypothetical protein